MMSNLSKTLLLIAAALVLMLLATTAAAALDDDLHVLMTDTNQTLTDQGSNLQLNMIEYYTAEDQQGRRVYFNNVGHGLSQAHFGTLYRQCRTLQYLGPLA